MCPLTHHLLSHEDLRRGDLDTEVTSSDHDSIGDGKNLIEVGDTLLVLNLDDDLDGLALLAKDLSDGEDVVGRSDERRKDHVDAVLDTELEVLDVLLGESGKVDGGLGKVDTLSRAEGTVVDSSNSELVAFDGEDLEGKDSVIDEDVLARSGDLDNVGLKR